MKQEHKQEGIEKYPLHSTDKYTGLPRTNYAGLSGDGVIYYYWSGFAVPPTTLDLHRIPYNKPKQTEATEAN
jgi:hypothetical protein